MIDQFSNVSSKVALSKGQENPPGRRSRCAVWSWLENLQEAPRDEWEALLARQTRPSPFLSPSFLLPWCSSFVSGPQKIGLWRPQGPSGPLAGLISLYREGGKWVLCGGQDVADRLDALIWPDLEEDFWEQFFSQAETWGDPLQFPNIGAGSPLLDWLERRSASPFQASVAQTDSAPFMPLPKSFEDYLAGLTKKNRHELRRKIRRAEGAFQFQVVAQPAELEIWLPAFIRLHRLSHPDKGAFMSGPMELFFVRLCEAFAYRGGLRIGFLLHQDEPIASMLQLDFAGNIHLYNSGYNPQHGHLSPGLLLLARCVEDAIALGRREFDFLRGTERYKYDLGGQDRGVYRVDFSR